MRSGEQGGPRSCREGGQVLGEAKQTAGQKACGVSTPQRMWKSDVPRSGKGRGRAGPFRRIGGGGWVELVRRGWQARWAGECNLAGRRLRAGQAGRRVGRQGVAGLST